MKKITLWLACIFLVGCAQQRNINPIIEKYHATADQVSLGDTKSDVLKILLPTQQGLDPAYRKPTKKAMFDGREVEIYFMRSGQFDITATDCENWTPYVFVEGILYQIGCSSQFN
jgi:hypothetical protein